MTFRVIIMSAAAAIVAAALSGCMGEHPVPAPTRFHIRGTTGIATTSDARLIYSRPRPDQNTGTIICSEPSPDTATAVSRALELSANGVLKSLFSGSGTINSSTAEAITELAGRTEAVVALRDGLFKACEAYANYMIGREAYALILGNYGDLLVTLMAEEAAGSAGQKSSSVASSGLSSSGGSNPVVQVSLNGQSTSTEKPAASSTDQATQAKQLQALLKTVQDDETTLKSAKTAAAQKTAETKLAADTTKLNTAVQSLSTLSAAAPKSSSGQVSDIYAVYSQAALMRLAQSALISCAVYKDGTLPLPLRPNVFLNSLCNELGTDLQKAIPALLGIPTATHVGISTPQSASGSVPVTPPQRQAQAPTVGLR